MAYGAETHADFTYYEVTLDHAGTSIRAFIRVNMTTIAGDVAAEALRDQVFQAFLTRVTGMPQATLVSATKNGSFVASVTP